MSKALKVELHGTHYHITSRGNACSAICFSDESPRYCLTLLLAQLCERFREYFYAYCLMNNQYHLPIETTNLNYPEGMRHLNGVYSQWVNRAYARLDHLYQSRHKAILFDNDSKSTISRIINDEKS